MRKKIDRYSLEAIVRHIYAPKARAEHGITLECPSEWKVTAVYGYKDPGGPRATRRVKLYRSPKRQAKEMEKAYREIVELLS